MDIKDYVGLQAVNGLIGGCMSLLRAKNEHAYRLSEMGYQSHLSMETMKASKQIDFQYQQLLQSEKFRHELETLELSKELDLCNGVRMQVLSHALRLEEAEKAYTRQMDLLDRQDNKMVWPLQTAIGQADLFKKDYLTSTLPINVFVVGNDEFKCPEVEREINRKLESFFSYHGYGMSSPNAVFGRFGAWKSAKYSSRENINLLWSVMNGVPVMIIRPEFCSFGEELEYQIIFWGNNINQEGYANETVFSLPYDISDNDKKRHLVKEVASMICCFAGTFCDCYHLVENGTMPQMPFAMKSRFGELPTSVVNRVIDIYRTTLYAITQIHYLGDYTPIAYLNVIRSLSACGNSETIRTTMQQLLLESIAVWENERKKEPDEVPAIPTSLEEGILRIKSRVVKQGIGNPEYIGKLYQLLSDLNYTEGIQLKELDVKNEESTATSGSSFSSEPRRGKIPSNRLVEIVKVEGGTFMMGSNSGDDEKPVHQVTLDSFYIGKYPVTQRQWKEVMGEDKNPSKFLGDNRPVENVSWYDAISFCNALSREEGFEECYLVRDQEVLINDEAIGYRLPTESEWEFAARGGTLNENFTYSGGDTLSEMAWYDENSGGQTHAVGKKKPNGLGLFDMSGNVWEWCWDWKGSYPSSPQTNLLGPNSGDYRVFRGGSWLNSVYGCRVAYRNSYIPASCNNFLGFRLVFVF